MVAQGGGDAGGSGQVTYPPPVPWVSDPAQHRQQARRVVSSPPGKAGKMANGRVNR
jgi:hypothetical protein